jgi:hypothetical protein
MAIPILPLPAGGTGLQALMGGFQQGLQNAGQIQRNRLNQLLTEAQSTKNQYLPAQLKAAATQAALRNQYLQGQVTEQPQLFQSQMAGARGRQALTAEQLREMQGLYPAQQQKASLGNQLLQARINGIGKVDDYTSPIGKAISDHAMAVKQYGANSPQATQTAQYVALLASGKNGQQINVNLPGSLGPNGYVPPNNEAAQSGDAGVPSQMTPSSMASLSGVQNNAPLAGQYLPVQPISGGVGANASSVPYVNPLSLQSRWSNAANVIQDNQGNAFSVPTQTTASYAQKALIGERNALSPLDDLRKAVDPELAGLLSKPVQWGSQLKYGTGQGGDFANFRNAQAVDLKSATEALLQVAGLNKTNQLLDYTQNELKPYADDTPTGYDQRISKTIANTIIKGKNYQASLKGIALQPQELPDQSKLQNYIYQSLQNNVPIGDIIIGADKMQVPQVQIPSNFASKQDFSAWYNALPDYQKEQYKKFLRGKK